MGKYFGTDGFRGEANKELTVEHAFMTGRFLGHYYTAPAKPCKVVIGKDTRLSSYMFEYALAAGLTASGADVYLLHVTTTPSVSYVARTEGFDCGIMISASHNPYWDNGIKLINGSGEKMEDTVIEALERCLDGKGDDIPFARRDRIGRTVDYAAGRNRYIGYLISLATHSFKGVRVALDCANGSTWMIARNVFEALGAQVFVTGDKPDGTNINRECGSTHIENLKRLAREHACDVGFAFDGDADRCLAVDDKGGEVDGDDILYIYGTYMKSKGKLTTNTVVATVMSNLGFFKALEAAGIQYVQTKVGDKYVYEAMREGGHLLGGEQSGHIIFAKYANTGDGLLTAIKLMQAMLDQKLPLSKLREPLKRYPQQLRSVRVGNKDAALSDPGVVMAISRVRELLGEKGRVLVRKSGTEPVLRVMAEAPEDDLCRACVEDIVNALAKSGQLEE